MLPTATIAVDRPAPGLAVIAPAGSLDVYSAADIRAALTDVLNEARYRQVVDLSEVEFIDSTGLAVIVGAFKRARGRGGELVLAVDLDGGVGKALRVTGLHKVIRCVPDLAGALGLLKPQPEPPVAPSPSVIAAQILSAQVRDIAREVFRDQIEARLDALADSGQIRGYDHEALCALAGAVERELCAAADDDRITVTITEPEA
jgi:anti-sigma B factor antagonist